MNPSANPLPPALNKILNAPALAGAAGGLGGFFSGEVIAALTGMNNGPATSLGQLIFQSASWSAAIGVVIGAITLVNDNLRSLRGQADRDLWVALPIFLVLSFIGGVAGQAFFLLAQNSLMRGIGWALMGLGVGAGIGLARRNLVQAGRGALGGAIGGLLGGLIFDALANVSSAGGGALSRCVGTIIMGALIALLIQVVQNALRNAWLLGISTGPYEGKEYTLSTSRVTVGQGEGNDICLYRLPDVPYKLGELVFHSDNWWWSGQPIGINGVPQTNAMVQPGDTLFFGSTQFRFLGRSVKAPVPQPAPIAPPHAISAVPPTFSANWSLADGTGRTVRLPAGNGAATVGRQPSNDLVLSDAAVSSNHARLNVDGGVLTVVDLNSTNGTFVNGQRLTPQVPAPLRTGDRVKFAALEFVVQSG